MRLATFIKITKAYIKNITKLSQVDTIRTYGFPPVEKIISTATANDDFVDNQVIVGISHELGISIRNFTKEDFPGIDGVVSVDSERLFVTEMIDNRDKYPQYSCETYNGFM